MKSHIKYLALLWVILLIPSQLLAKEHRVITVGTSYDYAPFTKLGEDGISRGFDIDIIQAICKEVNLTCNVVNREWQALMPSLSTRDVDLIAAAISITQERENKYNFSIKYASNPTGVVVRRDLKLSFGNNQSNQLGRIGATRNTVAHKYLTKYFADQTITEFRGEACYSDELKAGYIDSAVEDVAAIVEFLKTEEGACCRLYKILPPDPAVQGKGLGFGMRKDDPELKALIDKGINIIRNNGTYKKINDKYFSFNAYGVVAGN